MTGRADFTDEEWKDVLQGPPTAGMIVITADRGGTFRETISMAKAYSAARSEHGESQLLDEIAATKPEIDRTRYGSVEELREHGLQHLREIVGLLEGKAGPDEVDDYKRFAVGLAQRVAEAHKEHGERVSEKEAEAIAQIAEALGTAAPAPPAS